MKKYLYLSVVLITCFAACKKDSLTKIPLEKSFDDPSAALKTYQSALNAGDGWKTILVPSKSGQYSGFFKFETTGDSKYVLDNSFAGAGAAVATKYYLSVTSTNPTITFPNGSLFANFALNSTLGIDTAYTFKYSSPLGDTIKLLGNSFGSAITLIKTTKADADDYLAGKLTTAINAVNSLNNFKFYYKRITLGGKDYDLIFNTKSRVISFNYSVGGVFTRFSTYYSHVLSGIVFNKPFIDGATTIVGLSGLVVDLPNNKATATSGATAIAINNFATPVIVDLTSAKRFYSTVPTYWVSYTGFTVDGVTDALGEANIPGFNFLLYYPKYNTAYDRLGFIVNGAYGAYGPAIIAAYPTDGRITFTNFGSFGTAPTAIAPIVSATTAKFLDTQGYYVFQTGINTVPGYGTYDWVSAGTGATAGRSWISFE